MRQIDADALKIEISGKTWELNRVEICKIIDKQLTIEPERKKGKWIGGGDYPRVCFVCGDEWDQYVSGTIWYDGVPDFFPSCGSDMRKDGEADESD